MVSEIQVFAIGNTQILNLIFSLYFHSLYLNTKGSDATRTPNHHGLRFMRRNLQPLAFEPRYGRFYSGFGFLLYFRNIFSY